MVRQSTMVRPGTVSINVSYMYLKTILRTNNSMKQKDESVSDIKMLYIHNTAFK